MTPSDMPEEGDGANTSSPSSYPGLHFTPPPGTVGSDDIEGEGLVRWRKVGDSYTIVEFEGKPLEPTGGEDSAEALQPTPPPLSQRDAGMMELDAMAMDG